MPSLLITHLSKWASLSLWSSADKRNLFYLKKNLLGQIPAKKVGWLEDPIAYMFSTKYLRLCSWAIIIVYEWYEMIRYKIRN